MNDNDKILPFKRKPKPALTPSEQAEVDARKETERRFAELQAQEDAGAPCEATIQVLEAMLACAKRGEISGVAGLAYNVKERGFNRYNCMSRKSALEGTFDLFALTMIGALDILRSDLGEVAFYREKMTLTQSIAADLELER